MKARLEILHDMRFRPWDALLVVPLISVVGVMICIIEALPGGWVIFCVGTSGASIGIYLLVDWLARRPGFQWERGDKRRRRDAAS